MWGPLMIFTSLKWFVQIKTHNFAAVSKALYLMAIGTRRQARVRPG